MTSASARSPQFFKSPEAKRKAVRDRSSFSAAEALPGGACPATAKNPLFGVRARQRRWPPTKNWLNCQGRPLRFGTAALHSPGDSAFHPLTTFPPLRTGFSPGKATYTTGESAVPESSGLEYQRLGQPVDAAP